MAEEMSRTRRQRRITARRTQILDAAAQVFAEKGFARATTKEIAAAADVSEGTIYNYFASKDELLLGLMSHMTDSAQFDTALLQSLDSDPRDFVSALLRFRYDLNCQNRPVIQTMLAEILINPELAARYRERILLPLLTLVEQHIQARIAAGHIRPIDPHAFSWCMSTVFLGLGFLFVLGDLAERTRWEQVTDTLTHLLLDDLVIPQQEEAAR